MWEEYLKIFETFETLDTISGKIFFWNNYNTQYSYVINCYNNFSSTKKNDI